MPGPARTGDTEERTAAWQRLGRTHYDVLVIGGGVIGAGVALDAATRGLRVALVEARDFASRHVARSSKLFHGGLRYLEQLKFGLVREALRERELMLTRLAPHLVKPVAFLYPLTHRVLGAPVRRRRPDAVRHDGRRAVGARPQAPDAGGSAAARARRCKPTRSSAHPLLRRTGRRRAAHDDRGPHRGATTARPCGPPPRSSASCTRATGSSGRGSATSRPAEETEVRANGGDQLHRRVDRRAAAMAGGRGRFRVRASKGVHIVVPRDRIVSETGLILRTEKSVLFVIPWGDALDHRHHRHRLEPRPRAPGGDRADIDYILEHVNTVLADAADPRRHPGRVRGAAAAAGRGERADVEAVPRARGGGSQPGLVAIAGGKYTTYRVMARGRGRRGRATDIPARHPQS